MTFSERRARKRSALRELVVYALVGSVLVIAGLLILRGLLGVGALPRYEGMGSFVAGCGIDIAGLLRYRAKMRGFGLRRT